MPKFLNNIDLAKNQLLNAVIHVESNVSNITSPTEGQIYYDSSAGEKTIYVYDGSNWLPTGQNSIQSLAVETSIASGDKLAFSDESETGDINNAITVDNLIGTGLQHVTEAAIADGDYIMFLDGGASGTAKKEALADVATLFAGTGLTASSSVIGVDASQTQITAVGTLDAGAISSGFGNIDIGSSNLTATGTVSLGATSFNDNNITNVGDINADSISVDAAGTGLNIDFSGANTAKSFITIGDNLAEALVIQEGTNDYLDICTTNGSETIHLGHGVSGTAITIGHSTSEVTIGDNLTVTGNLTVSGDTISANVSTLDVEDKNITLNKSTGDSSSTADGAGITIQDAVNSDTDATILWTAASDRFDFSHQINVSGAITSSGNITPGGIVLDGNTITGVDDSGEFTNDDAHIMTSAAVEDKILGYSYLSSVNNSNWSGTDLSVANGGTGASSLTDGGILLGSGTDAVTAMAVLADGEMIVGDGSGDPVAESGATLRTSIGVGTGDSPQFTGVELGHASDTTLARSAAGKATIEGQLIGVVETFHLDNSDAHITANNGASDSTEFTILHGMGDSRFYKVEVIQDSGNYDTVYADVTRPSDTQIKITFGSAVANGAYRAMVTRMA
tara:strand:- start:3285 stop:5150 length:1866 start_codon:yes stop_codon:yes gene_type:complete